MLGGAFFNFPPDFHQQIFGYTKILFGMLSPFLSPLIGAIMFAIVIRLILKRLLNPSPVSGATGIVARIIEKKKLIALLFAAISAFLTWFASQPSEFQTGFMLPIQLITGLVISDTALYTLAATLFGIAIAVLLL